MRASYEVDSPVVFYQDAYSALLSLIANCEPLRVHGMRVLVWGLVSKFDNWNTDCGGGLRARYPNDDSGRFSIIFN
jgi:hypothetical protein